MAKSLLVTFLFAQLPKNLTKVLNTKFSSKLFEIFRTCPNAFECILTYLNASEGTQMDPNRLEQVQKLRKTCEHLEHFAKISQARDKFRENFVGFAKIFGRKFTRKFHRHALKLRTS